LVRLGARVGELGARAFGELARVFGDGLSDLWRV
jgi:hypothetical protein